MLITQQSIFCGIALDLMNFVTQSDKLFAKLFSETEERDK